MGQYKYTPAIFRVISPIMLTKLFITLFLAVSVRSLIIPNSEASNFLSRQRRANGPFEEALPSSIKRECQKEQCDFEEYVEAKENETKKNGIKLREVIKSNSKMKDEFEQIYTYCFKALLNDSELSDRKGFNFLPQCLDVLNTEFENKGYFTKQDNPVTVDYNYGGNNKDMTTEHYGGY